MKNFLSKFMFLILSIFVILFIFVIGYKTLVLNGTISKSKYEDEITKIGKEKVNDISKKTEKTLNKYKIDTTSIPYFGNNEEEDDEVKSIKVLLEKSYIDIDERLEALSTYCGYFVADNGDIYMFYIPGRGDVNSMSLKDRNSAMIVNSKKIEKEVTKSDLEKMKELIKKIKISYNEEKNEMYNDKKGTKQIAAYNYKNNERISLFEEGTINVSNNSEGAENLIYLIDKYVAGYRVSYSDFEKDDN